jgi:xylulokinase
MASPLEPLLLGIDVGTSYVKALLATPAGSIVACAQISYPTDYPRPGWVEQDPHDWWDAVVQVTRTVTAEYVDAVAAIAVSGQGCAVTLVDAQGEVLHPAIIWMDSRAEPQCEALRKRSGAAILRINGKSPAPYNADPVLLWLQEHLPSVLLAARTSLTTTGYINLRLTGRPVVNASDASILFAFDLAAGDWSPELLKAFGLPRHLYPEVASCTEVIGGLTETAAAALGLKAGTPVVAGGEDTSSAGLASGATEPGIAFLSLGTAGTLNVTEARPLVHPQLLTFLHVLPKQYLVGGSMIAIGAALAWLRDILGSALSYNELTALAAQSDLGAGRVLFLPYLSGELQPINDGYARGAFFGLSLSTGRADLVRAVLEGTAYAIAHNLSYAEDLSAPIHEIRATGGPTRSPLWCQIIADVCGRPLLVVEDGGAPLGNALLAGAGIGLISNLPTVAKAVSLVRQVYAPDPYKHEHYRRLHAIYKEIHPRMQDLSAALARG